MNNTLKTNLQSYKLREVADILKLSPRTLYKYVHEGKLKGYKIPNGLRFTEDDIKEFISLSRARATRITSKDEKK